MYTAYYMPADNIRDPRKDGFETEQAAWDYIATRVCRGCRVCIEQGFAIYEDNEGNQEVMPIRGPWDTGCGAEWCVGLTKDFDAAKTEEDLWEAGGWEKVEDPNVPGPVDQERLDNIMANQCPGHVWEFEGCDDNGNVRWKCAKCPQKFIDSGDGGDG